MQDRIRLSNNKVVLASVINYEFNVDGTRHGIGNVVCHDRDSVSIDGTAFPLFVVWTIYPSYRDDYWECEMGDYSLNWNEAVERMLERFKRNGFTVNQGVFNATKDLEPF